MGIFFRCLWENKTDICGIFEPMELKNEYASLRISVCQYLYRVSNQTRILCGSYDFQM